MSAITKVCTKLLGGTFRILYGLVYFGIALSYSVTQRDFWRHDTEDERAHLARASRQLWSLVDGAGTIQHNFIRLANRTQLHYLSPRLPPHNSNTLVILLHGFPDTAWLYDRQFESALTSEAKFVALDLPGCGGSDDIDEYGPNAMLNTIVEVIIALKEKYLKSDGAGRCILVGHDWGGVIGFRIAAETQGLVDHVVTLNSLYPVHAEGQLRARVARAMSHLSSWQFGDCFRELRPVLSQLGKSGYTFMLTLPLPKARIMPRLAFCLLKYAHSLEYQSSHDMSPDFAATQLAKAYGPNTADIAPCSTTELGYGTSVLARSKTNPPGDFDQRVRLYSERLLSGPWTASWRTNIPTGSRSDTGAWSIRAQHTPIRRTGPSSFRCPVTIIFGLRDIALNPLVVLDGIEKYFVISDKAMSESRVIRLSDCGHWSILEESGAGALEQVLSSLIGA